MNFSECGHPIFRASSAFERGELISKGHGNKSTHFNGSHENIELLLRTVISANQLSIYGAAADFCNEVPKIFRAPVKLAALDRLEKMEIPTGLSIAENSTNAQQRRNLLQDYERKFKLSEDQKLSKLCSDAGLKLVEQGQYFHTLDAEEGQEMQQLCRECTMPRNEKRTRIRGWILKNTRIGPVLNIKVCYRDDRYSSEVQIPTSPCPLHPLPLPSRPPVLRKPRPTPMMNGTLSSMLTASPRLLVAPTAVAQPADAALFEDNAASWVRIVTGVDKYVTESMLTKKEEDIASEKPIAKARPRQKPTVTLTSVSVPVRERKWIDIGLQRVTRSWVLWSITRLLRHDQSVPRGNRRSNPQQWHHRRVQDEEVRRRFAMVGY